MSFSTGQTIVSLITTALGFSLLYFCRVLDRKNYILSRAPRLPFTHINEADDVWLGGSIRCEKPVHAPYFNQACVFYTYTYEVEEKDSKGKRDWKTKRRESESADFFLHDDEGNEILILGADAEFYDLIQKQEKETAKTRHTIRYFLNEGTAHAMGLVGEKKKILMKTDSIPLVVTAVSPDEHIERESKKEGCLRSSGFFFLWISCSFCLMLMGVQLGYLSAPVDGGSYFKAFQIPSLVAIIPMMLLFSLSLYNTMVEYRIRTENAWRLVYIDMKNRYDLLPQIQEVIKGASAYEAETLRKITEMRTGLRESYNEETVQKEGVVHKEVMHLIALKEDYPELGTNPLYQEFSITLKALEDKIAHGRSFFNDNAAEYNTLIQKFPHVLLASLFQHKPLKLFHINDEE